MSTNLIIKYIRMYLGILGGFLLLMIPVYITVYQETEELILTERYSNLKQEVIYQDERISKMSGVMELVAENASVKKIAGIKGEPMASDSMDMLNAEKFLTSCFYLNEESYNQYLIFRDNPVVISSGEIMSSLTKQDYGAYGQEGMDFTEFQ